jgi:hypothetical protein
VSVTLVLPLLSIPPFMFCPVTCSLSNLSTPYNLLQAQHVVLQTQKA